MNKESEATLTGVMQEAGMDQKSQDGMLKGMAVMIAEYEAMKAKLVELGVIQDGPPPLKWLDGQPLVNLEEVIRKHLEGRNG